MAGLVGYDSSDEESDGRDGPQVQATSEGQNPAQATTNGAEVAHDNEKLRSDVIDRELSEPPKDRPRIDESLQASIPGADYANPDNRPVAPGPALGPALGPGEGPAPGGDVFGPSRRPAAEDRSADDGDNEDETGGYGLNGDPNEPPLSPYSTERAAVRQLTMPSVPDFDIPGSPEPDAAATSAAALAALNKKFATFLELKQKKDTHFNARLAQSDAMKNPALMDKLMAFVGMPANAWGGSDPDVADENGSGSSTSLKGKQKADKPVDTVLVSAQYATTLPPNLWDPTAFPPEAYRRSLRRLQEDAAKQRARAPGERVEFEPSTASTPGFSGGHDGSQHTSRPGTPATATATGKRKTRFD
ncbi:uncharacterized protein SPSK_07613 [Sporothrix schenckii 1099-18]|uniref:HCNGP-like protein n=1 Tax=Sporothrix schenckii 1099-18 TaxID=1397361 RepID=A0A0F2MI13_SPOSC|nr:uncharacterized protein SPSK_07613 [Sporothrix schenckii 1099-18]KJR88470.1 hypothetical protein SPSK_07613 [Sporothrix schenckii 1099-18]